MLVDLQKGQVSPIEHLVLLVVLTAVPAASARWEVAFFSDFNRPDYPVGAPGIIAGT